MQSIYEYATQHTEIDMVPIRIPGRPGDEDWHSKMDHWAVHLFANNRHMLLYHSRGSAYRARVEGEVVQHGHAKQVAEGWLPQPPLLTEILDSLASEAMDAECNKSFTKWCEEWAGSTDSRRALRTYRRLRRGAKTLRKLLGTEAYNELLFDTERL